MQVVSGQKKDEKVSRAVGDVADYREAVRRLIETEVKNALDEEMRKAAQELIEEQKKAIRQIVEEHKAAIREVVEDEKKAIWSRAEALRESILKVGL